MSSFFYIFLFIFTIFSNSVLGENLHDFQNIEIEKPARIKHLYISASSGYLHQNKNMFFNDMDDCKGVLKAEFLCKQKADGSYINNEIKTQYKPATSFAVALGINSDDAIRFELNYQILNKNLILNGTNQNGIDYNEYKTDLKLSSGSINVFLDFLTQRNDVYSVFIPYIMGGFGFSGIKMDDIILKLNDGSEWNFIGSSKDNKTYTLGFGFTAGINNYLSLDIGYRYYNFGEITTDKTAIKKDNTGLVTATEHIGLKSNLKLESVMATLKFQI